MPEVLVDFPSEKMVIFHNYVDVYQRVHLNVIIIVIIIVVPIIIMTQCYPVAIEIVFFH